MDPLDVEARHDEIEFAMRADKAEAHETLGRSIPQGEYGRVTFLSTAAEHWMMRGDNDRARALLEEIQDEPSEGEVAARATQLQLAFATGDKVWATALLKQLLADFRADLVTVSTCHFVGDLLRENNELRQAHRWFTLPLAYVDPDDDLDAVEEMCVRSRAQVRRQLGFPHDRFDAVADELAAIRRNSRGATS